MLTLKQKLSSLTIAALLSGAATATAQTAYDPMGATRGGPAQQKGETIATNPDFENLPDTEGVEETFYQCVACHSTAIIKQQSLSDARWDYLWGWMIDEQGMPEADPETKALIMTYLKRHFSSER